MTDNFLEEYIRHWKEKQYHQEETQDIYKPCRATPVEALIDLMEQDYG